MSEENSKRTLDYIWISRCAGSMINRNVEYKLTSDVSKNIKPLIEVVNEKIFPEYVQRLKRHFGEVMVDFPLYLLELGNKFFKNFRELNTKYINSSSFYQRYRNLIDIPVVSASQPRSIDYGIEQKILDDIKKGYSRVAVRIRVPTFDILGTKAILTSFQNLIKSMNEDDILLFDIFTLTGIENQINQNLKQMIKIAKLKKVGVFILNAFEPYDQRHNFGPLFSYSHDVNGFGDFATEKRFPPAGGRAQRKIVRYYYWDRYMFKEIADANYRSAATQLKNSNFWNNHQKHVSSCRVCLDVKNNRYNEGNSYWKKFRMLHYLNTISNETMQQYSQAKSAEDFDPDGYELMYNISGSKK